MEIWKDIKDYEGLYQVSNFGNIRSLNYLRTGKIKLKKLHYNNNGYFVVGLWKNNKGKTFFVHRLVAEAFIPNPDNLPQVNHKDECKTNNCVENLEWCSCQYNLNYGTRNKRSSDSQRNDINKSKPVLQLSLTGELIREWPSTHEIERKLGYKRGPISDCCRGNTKQKTSHGFIWKYKKDVR